MEYSTQALNSRLVDFIYRVYGLMGIAFSCTALTAYFIATRPSLYKPLMKSSGAFFAVLLVQFALVIAITLLMPKLNSTLATLLFFVYAVSMGVTSSVVFLVYDMTSIYIAFFVSAGMFISMALYGYFTRTDLSSVGNLVLMLLVGLMIGLFINLFLKSDRFDIVLSSLGVIIFTALTAYDTQRVKYIGRLMLVEGQPASKVAIFGALTLYLDFVNLFLYMLNLTGRRKD
jgi:FtsH-binding integral membrane protein